MKASLLKPVAQNLLVKKEVLVDFRAGAPHLSLTAWDGLLSAYKDDLVIKDISNIPIDIETAVKIILSSRNSDDEHVKRWYSGMLLRSGNDKNVKIVEMLQSIFDLAKVVSHNWTISDYSKKFRAMVCLRSIAYSKLCNNENQSKIITGKRWDLERFKDIHIPIAKGFRDKRIDPWTLMRGFYKLFGYGFGAAWSNTTMLREGILINSETGLVFNENQPELELVASNWNTELREFGDRFMV